MEINGVLFLAIIVILVSIPEINGESVSVGRGSSVAVGEGYSAKGIFATDGVAAQSVASSTGVIDELIIDPWIKNSKGDYVSIGVSGTNLAGFTYRDNYYPAKNQVAKSNAVWAEQWFSADSAGSLHAYERALDSRGNKAGGDFDLTEGSVQNYYGAGYSGPAIWLDMSHVAAVHQNLDKVNGNEILIQTWAVDSVGDAAGTLANIKFGALNKYSASADSAEYSNGLKATRVNFDSMNVSALFGSIYQVLCVYDNKGDFSQVNTTIDGGNLNSNSSGYSSGQWGLAESNQNIDANGSLINVRAYAQNEKLGYEYLTYSDGTEKFFVAPNGTARFEFETSNELATNINSKATLNNVLITPMLPLDTRTAILLEPMHYAFTSIEGATDSSSTIVRTLVNKKYAVLRYTDSGASIDKFQDLDRYNVALINSHMNNQTIILSSSPWKIDAFQLENWYVNPPKNSLAILAGCNAFEGYPQYSPLANATSKANSSAGFSDIVGTLWCSDYISEIFNQMGEGMTMNEANEYAWNFYRTEWLAAHPGYPLQLVTPLSEFGNKYFKLY